MKPRRFYMVLSDSDHPRAIREMRRGDLLIGPNVVYEVLDCWPTRGADPRNKWTCTVRRIGQRPRSLDSWAQLRLLYPAGREIAYEPGR